VWPDDRHADKPFMKVFTRAGVRKGWEHIGACPFTMASLINNPKLRVEAGSEGLDSCFVQLANTRSMHANVLDELKKMGFNVDALSTVSQPKVASEKWMDFNVIDASSDEMEIERIASMSSMSAGNLFQKQVRKSVCVHIHGLIDYNLYEMPSRCYLSCHVYVNRALSYRTVARP
jgi:hypothetical protein